MKVPGLLNLLLLLTSLEIILCSVNKPLNKSEKPKINFELICFNEMPRFLYIIIFLYSSIACFAQIEQPILKEAEKHFGKQDWAKAGSYFEKALQVNPQSLNAALGLAECMAQQGELRKTILYCNIASDIIENYKATYKDLKSDSITTVQKIEENLNQLQKKEGAIYHLKGKAKSKMNEPEAAFIYLQKASDLDPENEDIWIDMGIVRYQQKKHQEAEDYFLKALAIEKDNFKALFNLGNIKSETGNISEAINYYQKAVKKNPSYSLAFLYIGDLELQLNNYRKAIEAYSSLIDNEDYLEEAYFKRASAYNMLGLYENALQDWSKSFELNNKNYDALRNRGLMYMVINKHDAAIQDFTWLIENNEKEVYAYLNRSYTYLLINKKKKAMKDVESALEKKPQYDQAYYYKGLIYAFQNKKKKACKEFNTAINLGFDVARADERLKKMCL
jgi:tetratricopeptide (TPR) repeat protein